MKWPVPNSTSTSKLRTKRALATGRLDMPQAWLAHVVVIITALDALMMLGGSNRIWCTSTLTAHGRLHALQYVTGVKKLEVR